MPKCYQMVGVPYSGKSTWISNQEWLPGHVIVSTDKYVEEYAQQTGRPYREVFDEYMPAAIDRMTQEVTVARNLGLNIIWDQTSTTRQSRARKFRMLPDYDHIAVVFDTPDHDDLCHRIIQRSDKVVPEEVIDSMIAKFEKPVLDEGFTEIWFAR